MATKRISHAENDLVRASDLIGLGQSMGAMTNGVVDASDVYRAALVQAIAALDHYCHGVILDRAVDIVMSRTPSGKAAKLGIPFEAVRQIVSAPTPWDQEQVARTHVAQRLALETFQRSDSIANGLAAVGVGKIWTTAFGTSAEATMLALNLIVDRRNKIVHQGDSDPLNPGMPVPLAASGSIDATRLVRDIVTAIDVHC